MSKVHVLDGASGRYIAVLHATVPSGTNSVGVTWKSCLLYGGSKISVLPVGTGFGQITQVELDQIVAGDVIEYSWEIPTNADGSAPSVATILALADAEIAKRNVESAVKFKFFGYTQ